MPTWLLHTLNAFFFVFHTALCLFNLLGWAHRKSRKWHLLTMGAVALSWFVFGFWRGWGYCLCTDWHMQIRRELGIHDQSTMYVQLVIEKVFATKLPDDVVVWGTGGAFAVALVLSVALNLRDTRRNRGKALLETT